MSAPDGIRIRVGASTGLHDRPLHYRGVCGEDEYMDSVFNPIVNAEYLRSFAKARCIIVCRESENHGRGYSRRLYGQGC